MKKSVMIVGILCVMLSAAHGHPGKTDYYGGHRCLSGCAGWGLFYDEYHLHDKDGNPIHVSKQKKRKPEKAEPLGSVTNTVVQEPIVTEITKTVVVTKYRYVSNGYEENIFQSNQLLYILLMLLMLLLILRMNRRRKVD